MNIKKGSALQLNNFGCYERRPALLFQDSLVIFTDAAIPENAQELFALIQNNQTTTQTITFRKG